MKDNAIQNRYDFVIFFDVENGNPTAIPTPAICLEWIRKPATV